MGAATAGTDENIQDNLKKNDIPTSTRNLLANQNPWKHIWEHFKQGQAYR